MKHEERDKIFSSFPGLGKDEKLFKFLCYIAYTGDYPTVWVLPKICGSLRINQELAWRTYRETLEKEGYLTGNVVSPQWHFKILFQMLDCFPSLAESFGKISDFRYESAKYLWNIAVFLHRGEINEACRTQRPNLKRQ